MAGDHQQPSLSHSQCELATAREKKPRKSSSPTFDCDKCGLKEKCLSGQIKRSGKKKEGILIIGLCPGKEEDRTGALFTGPSGRLLENSLSIAEINFSCFLVKRICESVGC